MTPFAPLTRENVYDPLFVALERLADELANGKGCDDALAELDRARAALARMSKLLPTAQDVLTDFLGGLGPLDATFNEAESEAGRQSGYSRQLTEQFSTQALRQVHELFNALAPTPELAQVAYAKVSAMPSLQLLALAVDEAQKDGCDRGGYTSEPREAAVQKFIDVVAAAARDFLAQ